MKTFKQFLLEEENNNQLEKLIDVIRRDCKPFLAENVILYRGIKTAGNKPFLDDFENFGVLDIKTRKDRNAKDSAAWLHDTLGEAFKKVFGINFRTEAVFATNKSSQADAYGRRYLIFPKGNFNYVWSPVIQDAIELESNLVSGGFIDIENPANSKQLFKTVMQFLYSKIDISEEAKEEISHLKSFYELRKLVNAITQEKPENLTDAEKDIFNLYSIADTRQFTKDNLLEFLEKNMKLIYNFNKDIAEAREGTEIMIACDSYYAVSMADVLANGIDSSMTVEDFFKLIRK